MSLCAFSQNLIFSDSVTLLRPYIFLKYSGSKASAFCSASLSFGFRRSAFVAA